MVQIIFTIKWAYFDWSRDGQWPLEKDNEQLTLRDLSAKILYFIYCILSGRCLYCMASSIDVKNTYYTIRYVEYNRPPVYNKHKFVISHAEPLEMLFNVLN